MADRHVLRLLEREPFAPVSTEGAWALNEAQQKMRVELDNESGQIVNRYIRGR